MLKIQCFMLQCNSCTTFRALGDINNFALTRVAHKLGVFKQIHTVACQSTKVSLHDSVCPPVSVTSHCPLCPSVWLDLLVPLCRTAVAQRCAFARVGPSFWNGMPPATCSSILPVVLLQLFVVLNLFSFLGVLALGAPRTLFCTEKGALEMYEYNTIQCTIKCSFSFVCKTVS